MTTHKLRLSLRLLLLVSGLLGAALGVIGLRWRQAEARNSAITSIFDAGGFVKSEDTVVDYTWTQASDNDLVHLKQLNSLHEVHLHGPLITDSGLDHLETIKSLKLVVLVGTSVSPDGIRQLKRSLPSCTIKLIQGGVEIDEWEWLEPDES